MRSDGSSPAAPWRCDPVQRLVPGVLRESATVGAEPSGFAVALSLGALQEEAFVVELVDRGQEAGVTVQGRRPRGEIGESDVEGR